MKQLMLALAFGAVAMSAQAGGTGEPMMAPEVVAEAAASSGGDNWVGVVLTLLLIGAALTSGSAAAPTPL